MVSRILVPVDLTALGEAKLPVAQEYARAFDAEVLLLHILPNRSIETDLILPAEASARAYLDILVAGMSAAGVRAAPLIRTGPTAASIVDEALAQHVDLIILGANVRPVLRTVVIGSVADEVVRNAHCPVLLVRPTLDAAAPQPLRNFADDAARAGPLRRRSLGLRTVEVGRIIGTVGRAHELGPDFKPTRRRKEDEERRGRIQRVMEDGKYIPPIELYKLGFGYYVLDGHHRVAVARDLDAVEIDAEVTEFVPLSDPQAARTFAERRAFERATGLTDVGAVHPESYGRLAEMIETFQREHDIPDYRTAAQRWYGQVYRPLWHRVRERRLTRYFPGDRSADFIARVGTWRAALIENGTAPPDPPEPESGTLGNDLTQNGIRHPGAIGSEMPSADSPEGRPRRADTIADGAPPPSWEEAFDQFVATLQP